jgi:hypothetical protein
MKKSFIHPLWIIALLFLSIACKKNLTTTEAPVTDQPAKNEAFRPIGASEFTKGTLAAGASVVVDTTLLKSMGGSVNGPQILVCNSPELVESEGWMLNPPLDGTGTRRSVSGLTNFYTFHFNRIPFNTTTQKAFYMILATNPNNVAASGTIKGNMLTKANVGGFTFPDGYFIERESYDVAAGWLNNTFNYPSTSFSVPAAGTPGGNYRLLASRQVAFGDGIDGRFEINVTNQSVFIYTVMVLISATKTAPDANDIARAVTLSQTTRAAGKWTDNFGYLVETFEKVPAGTAPYRFGRESGLYQHSAYTGSSDLTLPVEACYIGLCAITDRKKSPIPGSLLYEDQTAPNLALVPVPSFIQTAFAGITPPVSVATRSYGNYGHFYDMTLNVKNTKANARTIKLSFAFNKPNSSLQNAVYVGPVNVTTSNGPTNTNVTTAVRNRFKEPKTLLGTFTVPAASGSAQGNLTMRIRFYVPGLISAGNQFIVEAGL